MFIIVCGVIPKAPVGKFVFDEAGGAEGAVFEGAVNSLASCANSLAPLWLFAVPDKVPDEVKPGTASRGTPWVV